MIDGIKLAYSKELAQAASGRAKVDYLSVSVGMRGADRGYQRISPRRLAVARRPWQAA